MSILPEQIWLNALIRLIRDGELAWRWLWNAAGLGGNVHGQPGWPWAHRIATETLLLDLGLARQIAWSLVCVGVALLAVLLALFWRRRRFALGIGAVLVLLLAPWPPASLVLAQAVPTSFHDSPTGFSVDSIAVGARLYGQHCVACHGATGLGDGPQARTLTRSPPTLVSPLLSRRADGDLFWSILDGMRDTHGAATMPAFDSKLSDAEIWAALDYMKALAAGSSARFVGTWLMPVALPGLQVQCGGAAPLPIQAWRAGQRVRVIALDAALAPPQEDPRFQTLLLTPDGRPPRLRNLLGSNCVAASPQAWDAYASIAGVPPETLAGTELLADRAGWLRARGTPGRQAWSDADLLCTDEHDGPQPTDSSSGQDGLTALLTRMDAEPVRFIKGGFIH